ncbi:M28 family peptidase [Hymenobacter sp. BT18]|uniref:M28 family metallopeptidase n=1 Tax=Hymenobacter sp. BT18 TaxID=2835648 RepID=UPI00143E47A5|nr:M28 family peptidase [Hymenobacter sp. BT18]QIX61218.1 M28 family peptidase [Hymenobacter sp. BT18]
MARVRQTLTVLTSKRLHGRGYTHRGDQRAAAYLAKRFKTLGLKSWTKKYRQPFPLAVNTFPGALSVTLGKHVLRPGKDFIPDPTSGSLQEKLAVVYFDTLAFTDPVSLSKLLQQDLRHTAIVYSQAVQARLAQRPELVAKLTQASAVVALTTEKLTASVAATQRGQARLIVRAAAWPTREAWLSLNIEANLLPRYVTQNVLGYVPGTAVPDSFVVVAAHYDHLGELGRKAYFPGANDNASGTAMLLELAAYFAQPAHRLRYSVAFIGFSGEEAGLLGSQFFVHQPTFPLANIRFLLNLDLVGTGAEGITVVNGKVHAAEFQLLQQLNSESGAIGSIAARGQAANSDHFPFSEYHVPAFFWYTRGGTVAYHDVHDQAPQLPLTLFPQVFDLAKRFLTKITRTL